MSRSPFISSDGMRSQNRIQNTGALNTPEVAAMIRAGFNGSAATVTALNFLVNQIKSTVFSGAAPSNFGLLPICGTALSDSLYWLFKPTGASNQVANSNFLSADYIETGVSAGLKGNGTNKSLNPLIGQLTYSSGSMAMGVYAIELSPNAAFNCPIGGGGGSDPHTEIAGWSTFSGYGAWINSGPTLEVTATTVLSSCHITVNSTSLGNLGFYINGSLVNTQTGARSNIGPADYYLSVFSRTVSSTFPITYNPTSFSAMRCRTAYFGPGLTSLQVQSLHTAIDTFNQKLSRNV